MSARYQAFVDISAGSRPGWMQLKRTTVNGMPGTLRWSERHVGGDDLRPGPEARDEERVHERGDGEHGDAFEQLEPRHLPRDETDRRDRERSHEPEDEEWTARRAPGGDADARESQVHEAQRGHDLEDVLRREVLEEAEGHELRDSDGAPRDAQLHHQVARGPGCEPVLVDPGERHVLEVGRPERERQDELE